MSDTTKTKNLKRYIFPAFVCLLCIVIVVMAAFLKQNLMQIENMSPLFDAYEEHIQKLEDEIKQIKIMHEKQMNEKDATIDEKEKIIQELIAQIPIYETETFVAQLKLICEIATAEQIVYDTVTMSTPGKVAPITTKEISMLFAASVKAGINLTDYSFEEKISITDETITLAIPKASILSSDIEETSIKFYDKKNGFLNRIDEEDVLNIQKEAKKILDEKISKDPLYVQLLERAEREAEYLINSFLKPIVPGKEIILNFQ